VLLPLLLFLMLALEEGKALVVVVLKGLQAAAALDSSERWLRCRTCGNGQSLSANRRLRSS
jgi:hypothetical protein